MQPVPAPISSTAGTFGKDSQRGVKGSTRDSAIGGIQNTGAGSSDSLKFCECAEFYIFQVVDER